MKLSGEEWASHMAKNLASLHASCTKELGREQADRLVRLALDAAERRTMKLLSDRDIKCACPRNDAMRCAKLRYGDTDEPCDCACHEADDDEQG
jgi:hypothetical protein